MRFYSFFIYFFIFSSILFSYKLEMGDNLLDLVAGGPTTFINLSNYGSNSMVAVEVSVVQCTLDEQGVQKEVDAKDLIVIPSQILLPPDDEMSLLITYVGDYNLSEERVYRVKLNQIFLPGETDIPSLKEGEDSKAYLRYLSHYNKRLYVGTSDFSPSIFSEVLFGDSITLHMTNQGNGHGLYRQIEVTFFDESSTAVHVLKLRGKHFLPGQKITHDFEWPDNLAKKVYSYSFKYQEM